VSVPVGIARLGPAIGDTLLLLRVAPLRLGLPGLGAWLVVLNRGAAAASGWPGRLQALGVAAGALMAVGIVTTPGIVLGLDDMATAPAWVWIGFLGWLGTYVVYPAWAIWLGIVEARLAGQDQASSKAAPRAMSQSDQAM
jgi:hypothetical protein